MKTQEVEKPFFLREDGQKVYIQAISVLELNKAEEGIMAEYKQRGEPIEPPTYEVETAGGGKLSMIMNETNLVVEGNEAETAARQTKWADYMRAVGKMKADVGAVTTEIILDGIITDPPSEEWKAKRRKRHLILPEDPDELLQFYKLVEVLRTPGDLIKAQQEILLLSSSGSLRREDVEAASATFLRKVQGIGRRSTGEMADDRPDSTEAPEKPLDTQQPAKRTRRGKRMGNKTKSAGIMPTE